MKPRGEVTGQNIKLTTSGQMVIMVGQHEISRWYSLDAKGGEINVEAQIGKNPYAALNCNRIIDLLILHNYNLI